MDEVFIRSQIRRILEKKQELPVKNDSKDKGKEKKKKEEFGSGRKIITSVRGRPPAGLSQRAKKDPNGLLAALRVGAVSGETMIDKIESLLSQATGGLPEMEDAFSDVDVIENMYGKEGVLVTSGDISSSQGARFIKETLLAARNAGRLMMSQDIRVDVIPRGVIVYASKDGRIKWFDRPDKFK